MDASDKSDRALSASPTEPVPVSAPDGVTIPSAVDDPVIVAFCNCGCGRIVYGGCPEYADEAELGKMVREGYVLRTVPVAWARQADWFCARRIEKQNALEAAKPENVARRKYETAITEMRVAQGIEARQGGATFGVSVHESPVAEGDAP